MQKMRHLYLPFELILDKRMNKMRGFVQELGNKSGYFSFLLYSRDDKQYFLNKDQKFPVIYDDLIMYSMMRCFAKTIITSGLTLRSEKHAYQKDRLTFGEDLLKQFYKDNTKNPVNLFVYTKQMSDDEIMNIIDKRYFNYIPLKELFKNDGNNEQKKLNFKQIASVINSREMGPTIYESGLETLQQALGEVAPNEKSFAQLIVLSSFLGPMDKKYIGKEFDQKILNRDFDKVWESESYQSDIKMHAFDPNSNLLKFIVYKRK